MTMAMTNQLVHQAISLLEAGDARGAEMTARHLLKNDARNPELMFLHGRCLLELVRPDEAEKLFRKAIRKQPDEKRYLTCLGLALAMQGRFYPGMNAYSKALRKDQKYAPAATGVSRLYIMRGHPEQAESTLRPIVEDSNAVTGQVWVMWMRTLTAMGRDDEALQVASNHSSAIGVEPAFRGEMKRIAAGIHHRRRAYDKAFSLYSAANELTAMPYDHDATLEFFESLKHHYRDPYEAVKKADNGINRPIFIVGMPRCGSTLVEQIFDACPKVHGVGESHDLQQVMANATELIDREDPYPDCLPYLSVEELNSIADQIEARYKRHTYKADRMADKTLGNIAHVGFISRAVPEATIVHVKRSPIDTCLSCFTHDLPPRYHPWAARQEDIAAYYHAYEDLMAHWESVGIPMHTVEYEALVSDPEHEIRRMLKAANLEYTESWKHCHSYQRDVFTLSWHQVREPINLKGIGRWKLYERHLEPLMEGLGDLFVEPFSDE